MYKQDPSSLIAHWAPFIRAAVEYIQETYDRKDDPHVEGLISFIFAVMAHDVADVRWHSLQGLTGYFIDAMARMDFHGEYSKAHTVADTGAEFTLQHLTPRLASYINATTWHVPVRDLVNIYAKLYTDYMPSSTPRVPLESHLMYCMTTAFAASRIDYQFGQHLFGYYGHKSPFLVEDLVDYYKGGLQDMTASVTDCIANLVDAFEGIEPAVLCGSYFDNHDKQSGAYDIHRTSFHRHWMHSSKQMMPALQQHYDKERGLLTLSIQHEENDLEMSHDNTMPTIHNNHQRQQRPYGMIYQKEMMDLHDTSNEQQPKWNFPWKGDDDCIDLDTTTHETSYDHSLLTLSAPAFSASIGHTTTTGDFDGDGELDLAISAPYLNDQPKLATGAVYLLNGTRALLTNDDDKDATNNDIRRVAQVMLKGDMDRGRFGWAMATVDLNADGTDDLAVASPFSNRNRGHVDVFYGSTKHGIGSTKPDIRIALHPGSAEGFGVSLEGFDIDGDGHKDLLVGCPYCTVAGAPHAGAIYVFLSSSTKSSQSATYSIPDMVFKNPRPQPYERFGTTFESIDGVLLVGAPGYNMGALQRVGRVYAMNQRTGGLGWTMAGSREFQQFGSLIVSLATRDQGRLVAISSPSEETGESESLLQRYWQAGAVRVYDWKELNTGNTEHDLDYGLLRSMEGKQAAGHLGASMAFYESRGDDGYDMGLWVGEPMANGERGRVHKWSFIENDMVCMKNADSVSRFGSHLQSASGVLSITSAHYSRDARLAGAIHLILQ
ncbi:hypothetical protein LRAMOSA08189 [Lichtheimia ramosa]|uniref:Glycosyl-phosphatidylinositol-specific phospholipase D n=1 Tax=Lichtheimia ramosa TaxID=688394 RepID=A0A077WDC3_9FUNG|nr:hypothetical protein LRAMOSA08189 [Lichtheimia ramosa]